MELNRIRNNNFDREFLKVVRERLGQEVFENLAQEAQRRVMENPDNARFELAKLA